MFPDPFLNRGSHLNLSSPLFLTYRNSNVTILMYIRYYQCDLCTVGTDVLRGTGSLVRSNKVQTLGPRELKTELTEGVERLSGDPEGAGRGNSYSPLCPSTTP